MKKKTINESKAPEQTAEPASNIVKPKGFNWITLGLGVGLVVLGFVVGSYWFSNANNLLGIITTALLAGGGILIKITWSKRDDTGTAVSVDVKVENRKQVNSLNIYPEKVVFEDMPKPMGQPWQCLNDSKYYFIHVWNEKEKTLEPLKLPDQQYYDPQVFAERVLDLPAHRRIFRRKVKLLEQLKPLILVLAIGAVWILIMTTVG